MGQPSNRVAYLALGLAVVALGLHLVPRLRGDTVSNAISKAPSEVAPAGNAALLANLAARVQQLEIQRAQAPASLAAATETAAPEAAKPETRRLVSFELPSGALEVKQAENGALSVTNSDPALAGKMLRVKARADDGSEHEVTILVPPPAR
jgi:hypothetical protein